MNEKQNDARREGPLEALVRLAAQHCDRGMWPTTGHVTRDTYMRLAKFALQAHRILLDSAPAAYMDTRDMLGICAPAEADFPALYALQGKRVRLVLDEPNAGIKPPSREAGGSA